MALDCRNTRGYTIDGHARDKSRDHRLRIVHSLQLVQITQYLYTVLPDHWNKGVAIGDSLLSCIRAEI